MELYSDNTPDSMRAHADQLDLIADDKLRQANAEADELRRRARDYRHTAQMLDDARQPAVCNSCGGQIVRDSLGWRHPHPTECTQPVPAMAAPPEQAPPGAPPISVSPESFTETSPGFPVVSPASTGTVPEGEVAQP